MNYSEEFDKRLKYASEAIDLYAIVHESGYQQTVLKAMNYSVLAGGKRLRPMLMDACFRMCGGSSDIVMPFMAAIELIHTYSLVHDDLPAMDNDMLRRGKPTTHAMFNEPMAILAGDALLNYAYEVAIGAFRIAPRYESEQVATALSILSREAGIYGMVGGQAADVESEKESIPMDKERLMFIFKYKTGALIKAAMCCGAALAGVNEKTLKDIEEAASLLGIAFQIRDDILDVTGNELEFGKPIGSDASNNKETYVTLYGLEQAQKDVVAFSDDAINKIQQLPFMNEHKTFLTLLMQSLVNRTK